MNNQTGTKILRRPGFDDDYCNQEIEERLSKFITNNNTNEVSEDDSTSDNDCYYTDNQSNDEITEDYSDDDSFDYDYDEELHDIQQETTIKKEIAINEFLTKKKINYTSIFHETKYGKNTFNQLPNNFSKTNNTESKFKCFDTNIFNCIVIHNKTLFNHYYPNLLDKLLKSYHFIINFINKEIRNNFETIVLYVKNTPDEIRDKGEQVFMLDNTIIFELLVGRGAIYDTQTNISGETLVVINYDDLNKEIITNKPATYYEGLHDSKEYSPYKFSLFKTYPNDYSKPTHLGIQCKYAHKSDEEKQKFNHKCETKWCGSYNYPDKRMLYSFVANADPVTRDMYCISERVGQYFQFFVDLDLDDSFVQVLLLNDSKFIMYEFWKKIINVIIQTLKDNLIPLDSTDMEHYYDYIYSHKENKENKVHLYFPNIIVNQQYAICIANLCTKTIKSTFGDFIASIIDKVYDKSPYTGSMRLLYQRKCGDILPYDLVPERSTCIVPDAKEYYTLTRKTRVLTNKKMSRIAEIRMKYLMLVSVNQGHKELNCQTVNKSLIEIELSTTSYKEIKTKNIITKIERNNDVITVDVDYSEITIESCLKEMEKKLQLQDDLTLYTDYKSLLELIVHKRPKIVVNVKFIYDLANNLSSKRLDQFVYWRNFVLFCHNYGLHELAHLISQKYASEEDSEEWTLPSGKTIVVNSKYNPEMIDKLLNVHHNCNDSNKVCNCKLISLFTIIRWSKEDNLAEHNKILMKEYAGCFEERDFSDNNYLNFIKGIDLFNFRSNLEEYSEEFMKSYPLDPRIEFVKCRTGGGKSTQMSNYAKILINANEEEIKESSSDKMQREDNETINKIMDRISQDKIERVVIISSRCALTLGLQKALIDKGVNCKHYKDPDIDFTKDKIISITPDSLTKYKKELNYDELNVDLVIIDEVESLFNYIAISDTLENRSTRKEVYEILCNFMRQSKRMLFMDAHLNHFTINHVMSILAYKDHNKNKVLKESMKIIYNNRFQANKQYIQIRNKRRIYDILLKHLKEKKKIYICSDSLSESKMCDDIIKEHFKNDEYKPKGIVYNSESSDEDKKVLPYCNEIWCQYDYIITSPTIVYGLDFSIKDYFDNIFSINVNDKVFSPASIFQQINRIRYPKSAYVYVYCARTPITMHKHKYFNNGYNKLNRRYLKTRLFNSDKLETIEPKEETKSDPINYNELPFDEKLKIINKLFGVDMECKLKDAKLLKRYVEEFDFEAYNPNQFEGDGYMYDVNELSDMLDNYQNALTDFMYEYFYTCLGNYFCEYDGITFIQTNFIFDKSTFKKSLGKIMSNSKENFTKEQIRLIIEGSKRSSEYEFVVFSDDKTTKDNFTIIGTNIMRAYGLHSLDEGFFKKYPSAKQINKFINSVSFSMKEDLLEQYKYSKRETNFEAIASREEQRMILVKKLLECFFPNGLADDSVCIVTSCVDRLTDKQKEFINEYFYEKGKGSKFVNKVNGLFYDVAKLITNDKSYINENSDNNKNKKSKKNKMIHVSKINPLHMMSWLCTIVKRYFGYTMQRVCLKDNRIIKNHILNNLHNISWHVSSSNLDNVDYDDNENKVGFNNESNEENKSEINNNRKYRIKINIDKNQIAAYCYKQNQINYIELLLNSKFKMLNEVLLKKILIKYSKHKCEFSNLHGFDTIEDIYNKHVRLDNIEFETEP
jgi:hypothetical protein